MAKAGTNDSTLTYDDGIRIGGAVERIVTEFVRIMGVEVTDQQQGEMREITRHRLEAISLTEKPRTAKRPA